MMSAAEAPDSLKLQMPLSPRDFTSSPGSRRRSVSAPRLQCASPREQDDEAAGGGLVKVSPPCLQLVKNSQAGGARARDRRRPEEGGPPEHWAGGGECSQQCRSPADVERRVHQLYRAEARETRSESSPLVLQMASLFEALPDAAVPRVRALLDSGLLFRRDGSAVDLRSLVFEMLSSNNRDRVLRRIHSCCPAPPSDRQGFVVLSDVDDTLLPAHDILQLGGSDRSWHLDGRLYPGVSRMHLELRGGLREDYGGDYSVLLTARPPLYTRSLSTKLKRIAGVQNPRMGILPGQGGTKEMTLNMFRVLTGNYKKLGETKVLRIKEYTRLFPEYCGRFAFIGDDGQADVDAAKAMLKQIAPSGTPFFAFVAVHAVQQGDTYTIPTWERAVLVREMRKQHPGRSSTQHRFFYFTDYEDLALQLSDAGWLKKTQLEAIRRAAQRDRLPDLTACIYSCDLEGLRKAIGMWSKGPEEGDEAEIENFRTAGEALPHVVRAHVQLAMPPTHGVAGIVLQLRRVSMQDFRWSAGEGSPPPRLTFQEISAGRSVPTLRRQHMASDEDGVLRLPWPCEKLGRAAIDVDGANGTRGRCFVVLTRTTVAVRDGATTEVALLASGDTVDVFSPMGEVSFRVVWATDARRPRSNG